MRWLDELALERTQHGPPLNLSELSSATGARANLKTPLALDELLETALTLRELLNAMKC